ncbi:hypothetical protein [Oceanobacillus iheyensis HTE831]|uniref:Uncharacterized protein n=1 Tax=Oceanobacillus iheyensis (strain DSM 14371 / CIP 107618 / JCM 11309 / KCTC 3954 / HTE831) TaxID=221109 RepID=Q8ERM7_OCEIH|nr:hypothetical protein [Oceanobacillus iheyensis]BAC13230.1 hypothetical protein [Oceanobacillus iheyensis HTE831]
MKFTLEIIRIIIIFGLLGFIFSKAVMFIYSSIGIQLDNHYGGIIAGISIIISIFVLYRNKLQFSGFYKSDKNVKLSKPVSIFLFSISIIMLIIAPYLP